MGEFPWCGKSLGYRSFAIKSSHKKRHGRPKSAALALPTPGRKNLLRLSLPSRRSLVRFICEHAIENAESEISHAIKVIALAVSTAVRVVGAIAGIGLNSCAR